MPGDVFAFHVHRLCRIRGEHAAAEEWVPRESEAFRAEQQQVAIDPKRLSEGDLAPPEVIAATGAMVVLGEPGAGKTSVLKSLTDAVPRVTGIWEEDSDACLWISGGDLTEGSYEAELGSHLSSLPPAEVPQSGRGTLFVVLDQLDECGPFLKHLPRRLTRSLRGRVASRLRFLVACRTADYPTAMTDALTEIVGACRCVDLAPLSRAEAVELADSTGVPGEALVTAAEVAGASVMASVPLTLELLVVTYRADGHLTGKPTDLFARGVEALAQEPNPDRIITPTVTTSHQRLAIAQRIAAWTLLSGHRNVWLGRTLEASAFDLPGDVLADGTEATAGGSFDVTYEAVRETLATALFTSSGDNRVAFRHSSVAAYLAARYLTDRKVGQRQLENLFLVGTPDGDTASIPMPLRETAAWLVALRPHATAWLASADPESLAVHSAIVRSDEVRRLTVDRLLERALQVELGDSRWQLSRWDLRHPLLGAQLADALETAPAEGPADWAVTARVRLAMRIAEHAAIPDARLAAALLRLVENDAWHATERRLAASAAFACGDNWAVPVLRKTLASLDDADYAGRVDSEHDLRGTLLDLLWPDHLDVTTMLDALRPPNPRIFNMYARFLRNAPTQCADEHLPDLLTWAERAVRADELTSGGFNFTSDRIEIDFVDALIDRALSSPDAIHLTGQLAKIILRLFGAYEQMHLPECLQPSSQEPLRRSLAEALVEEAVRTGKNVHETSWRIVHDWKTQARIRHDAAEAHEQRTIRHQLLDGTDFAWALNQARRAAASPDERQLATWGEIAARLFPQDDHEAFDLAYDEDHPAWPYVSFAYEAIDIDGRYAKALRRSHQARQQRHWAGGAEFASEMAELLTRARAGDDDSLWRFVWLLQIDPRTGQAEHLAGLIHTWPGTAVVGDLHDLPELALRYLTTEIDHADSWITNRSHDKRSWVGYAFLIDLHEADRLAELPPAIWGSWAAAISTETLPSSTEGIRGNLLRLAATHAAEQLAHRLVQHCQAALTQACEPLTLRYIDPLWAPELRTAMEYLLTDLVHLAGDLARHRG